MPPSSFAPHFWSVATQSFPTSCDSLYSITYAISALLLLFYRSRSLLRAPQGARRLADPAAGRPVTPTASFQQRGVTGISESLQQNGPRVIAKKGQALSACLRGCPRSSKQPRRRVFLRLSERTVVLCHLEVVILHFT
jgi:hypothetical protein